MDSPNQPFSFSFTSSKSPDEVFDHLVDVRQWWWGLYNEAIDGTSDVIGDEFDYRAGDGAHYSKQKLIEHVPVKRVAWEVTDSRLSSFSDMGEWTGTKICFDIISEGNHTIITFTHEGLTPHIECYGRCTNAWTQYLVKLQADLK